MLGNLESIYTDPTLDAMHRIIEAAEAEKPPRRYLGASSIGRACERAIWYSINDVPRKPMGIAGIYATQEGHNTEALVASRLRMVPGIELWTEGEDGQQIGFTDGNFSGHVDGVIKGILQAPATPHIWEHKSTNPKKYAEFIKLRDKHGEKGALKEWNFTYYIQAQIYMHYLKLTRHYLTVTTPGGRDITSCRTEYKKDVAESYIARAKRIIAATQAPVRLSDNPAWYECKWCEFYEVCHGNA